MKRLLLSGAGLIAAALALSACGASAGAAPAATTTATSGAATTQQGTQPSGAPTRNAAAFEKFQACLAQHGVTVTPGQGFGGGFGANSGATQERPSQNPQSQDPQSQDPKARAAFTACRALLPQGSFGQRNGAEFQAFRTCLADHGVQEQGLAARPTASAGASASPNESTGRAGVFGLDLTNPKTKAAYDACKVLLPARTTGSIAPVPSASPGA